MASDPRAENYINTSTSIQGSLSGSKFEIGKVSINYKEIDRISIKEFGEKQHPQKSKPPKYEILMNPKRLFNHFLPILQNEQDNT